VTPAPPAPPPPPPPARPALKRKSESSPIDISLTIPRETGVPQSRSAPPERPRKLMRSRGHSTPQSALLLPTATFGFPAMATAAFDFTSLSAPAAFYPGTLPKAASVGPAELLPDYFHMGPVGMDEWIPPVEYMYRPHIVQPGHLPPAAGAGARHARYLAEQP
jgi:hypothetical protein